MDIIRRLAIIVVTALVPLAFVTLVSPGVSYAQECGAGTVYDPATDTCVAEQPAPPPPPPPPAWNGDVTPYFSVSVCVPIPVPFAPSVCFGA